MSSVLFTVEMTPPGSLVSDFINSHPVFTVVVAAFVLWQLYRLFTKLTGPKNLPPCEEGLIPWLGVGIQFGNHPINFATAMYKKYGEIFTLKMLGNRITFLVGPEAHDPFLRKSDEELDQNEPYRFAIPLFGPGVVYDASVEDRNQQLKFIKSSLSTAKLQSYVPLIVKEAEMFFDQWGDQGEVDLRKELSELIILTASRCLMGREIRENLFKEVASLFQVLDEGLTPLTVYWPEAPIPAHWRRNKARLDLVALFSKVIAQRRAKPEEEHNDVLQVFMDAKYRDGQQCSDEQITGLMIALLFAGQHTSSITSTWTGLRLFTNRQFLPAVLEEQDQVLREHNGTLDYEALDKMERLHRCVKEALRMNPPLILVMRKVLKSFDYKGFHIPAGDTLFVSPTLSHQLDTVFTNPEQYDPERFAPGREEDKKKPFSFIGFGGGRHGCMGEMFAYVQIKTIWSVLLRRFDLEVVGPCPEPDYSAMVVGPKQPCTVRYRRLNKSK